MMYHMLVNSLDTHKCARTAAPVRARCARQIQLELAVATRHNGIFRALRCNCTASAQPHTSLCPLMTQRVHRFTTALTLVLVYCNPVSLHGAREDSIGIGGFMW